MMGFMDPSQGESYLWDVNAENSFLVFSRKGNNPVDDLLLILNMTPAPRKAWRIGLPFEGKYYCF